VVKPNVLYPNLSDLIKIELNSQHDCITFTKTNNNVFCTLTISADGLQVDDECFLVGEKALNGLAQTTTSGTISIYKNEDLLCLIGNNSEMLQCPIIDINEFRKTPQMTNESIGLSSEALYCIKLAGNYISTDQKITAANYVQVGSGGIFSTNNNNIIYHRKFDDLPNFFLSEDALPVIKLINEATYSTHDNFDFINYPNGYSFGFLKSVLDKGINYAQMIAQVGQKCFTINRQYLINFCILVNYSAKSKYPIACLKFNGEKIILNHDDANFNVHVHKEYEITGNACDDFNFNVKWLEIFLKPLPYNELYFERIGHHFKITSPEDEEFTSIFAGIAG
jgi:hypothetical protein